MKHSWYNLWNPYLSIGICLCMILSLVGCSQTVPQTESVSAEPADSDEEQEVVNYFEIDMDRPYTVELPLATPQITASYSQNYAVIPYSPKVDSYATTRLCINNTENTVVDSENAFETIYPASVTKIMTALLTLEHGHLDDVYTLDSPIDLGDPMAVSLDLSVGDHITIRELLNGLLLESANDYAVALGRYVAGSDEAFVKMMNTRAAELGATHTHFTNPHGLQDDDHYTTGYDLYLIFRELVKYEEYREIAGQSEHDLVLTDQNGNVIHKTLVNSNQYVNGTTAAPDGITVLCGKTGTTNEAGCCLILLAKDSDDNEYITVICGISSHAYLYTVMNEELSMIGESDS